jgi:hypothetical protein
LLSSFIEKTLIQKKKKQHTLARGHFYRSACAYLGLLQEKHLTLVQEQVSLVLPQRMLALGHARFNEVGACLRGVSLLCKKL